MAATRLAMCALLAISVSGCAISMPMGSLFSRTEKTASAKADDEITTGSIGSRATTVSSVLTESKETITVPIAAEDWGKAKAALIEALGSKEDTPSVPWENNATNARGSVTALHRTVSTGGSTCRAFLGSALRDKTDTWFEGRACKNSGGEWEMQDLRPWKKG